LPNLLEKMAYIPYSELSGIKLYVLGAEDNRREARVNVVHQELFKGGTPYQNGAYDAHMGTTDQSWDCTTC
jgi:DNA-directed RNA polymerase beta' subunit